MNTDADLAVHNAGNGRQYARFPCIWLPNRTESDRTIPAPVQSRTLTNAAIAAQIGVGRMAHKERIMEAAVSLAASAMAWVGWNLVAGGDLDGVPLT